MNKNIILVAGLCLSVLAVSCSQSEHEEISEPTSSGEQLRKSNDGTYLDKSNIASKNNIKKSTLLGKKTISFNGEKYLFDGDKLKKGSLVRNIYMSESGRIKGTIVIVVKAGEILNISIKNKKKIAKDTFRLVPEQTDDLMAIYNKLLINDSIAIAELEVVYSGKESGALEY